MKKYQTSFLALVLIGLPSLLLIGHRPPQGHELSPETQQTLNPVQTGIADVEAHIAAREYQVHWQPKVGAYASPNRQNNLRVTYQTDGFSLSPRVDSVENWHLDYTISGLYRGTGCVMELPTAPNSSVCGATLEQNFGNGLQVQYVNSPAGMRQNFLLEKKPAGSGPLKLRLATKGSLYPVKKSDQAVVLVEENRSTGAIETRAWYKDLKVWDANGAPVAAAMAVAAPEWDPSANEWHSAIDLQVEDQAAAYPLWIDPISTSAATVLDGNQLMCWFGYSVSSAGDVNGDGYSDIIVGAPTYDNGQVEEGAAYIFHGSPTGIGMTAAAAMEADQANAYYGISCATAGDLNGDGYSDVIVGASQYNNGQVREGIAVIYYGSPAGISMSGSDTLQINQINGNFGQAVACAGDANGDGYSDVIVGAPGYDNGQTNEGIACIYHGSSNGILSTPASLVESDQVDAKLGVSVGCAGDVNGDGFSDGIVGAYLWDGGQTDEGRAYVYHGAPTGMSTIAAFTVESNEANAQMGASVASAGDVNGDGFSDVIIGVPSYSNGQIAEGSAFVYYGSGTGITSNNPGILESNQSNSVFGLSVAPAGDVNGDGLADVIVGANYFTNGENFEGAAFLYYGQTTGIDTTVGAMFEGNQADANMGVSVSSAGDVNGDGFSDVIVGAIFYDLGQMDEGIASIFHGAARGMQTTAATTFEVNQGSASLGCSVAAAGDVNGDGYTDMIVGARQFDNGQVDEGGAFLYHGGPLGLGTSFVTQLESNQANANFGISVSGAGDVNGDGYGDVVVGADLYDNGEVDEGAAFVYHGSPSGIVGTFVSRLESNQAGSRLGQAVASAGDINGDGFADVIAGAPYWDNGETDEGAAFTYHGDSAGIITTFAHRLESNQIGALMGWSVASAGDVNGDGFSDVIAGAVAYDQGQIDEGAAFVHHGSVLGVNPAFAALLEGNQDNASFGHDVASAGDVNGDGYSDVVVGAPLLDNGQVDEGGAMVYHGSSVGIVTLVAALLECNQAGAQLGSAVSLAGDLNGDGYGDVVAGAEKFANGQSTEGAVFVFEGSTSGMNTSYAAWVEGNQAGAELGHAVAAAGDVNGDGYSDVIAGAWNYDNGQTNEGGAMVYFGNGGQGRRVVCHQRRAGGLEVVGPGGLTGTVGQARLLMVGKSFLGRQLGLLAWEVVENGLPFTSAGGLIANSVAATGAGTVYSPLTATGTSFSETVTGFNTQIDYKWRMRVKYKLTTAITGQVYGPWYYHKSATPEVPMLGFKARACPIDNNPPTALCQGITIGLDSTGIGVAIPDSVNNGSTDNCSVSGYSLSPGTFTCADLGSNTVTLTVLDGVGNSSTCTATVTVVAYPFSGAAVPAVNTCGYHVSCPGGMDGAATATAIGGCPAYTYLWSNGDTAATATGLGAGIYTVTISDGLGGSIVDTVAITAPPAWQLGTLAITPACVNDSNGTVDLSATGGNGCSAYGYTWSNGDTTEDLTGVPPGSYTVTVIDVAGCSATLSVVVPSVPLPVPSFTQVGNVLVSTQTWSSYQWLLNGGNIPGATASSHVILQTGSYALQVTDSNGCVGISTSMTVVGQADPSGDLSEISLFPNPARGEFRLGAAHPINDAVGVVVSDICGRPVFADRLAGIADEVAFDIHLLAAGTYLVELRADDGQRRLLRMVVE